MDAAFFDREQIALSATLTEGADGCKQSSLFVRMRCLFTVVYAFSVNLLTGRLFCDGRPVRLAWSRHICFDRCHSYQLSRPNKTSTTFCVSHEYELCESMFEIVTNPPPDISVGYRDCPDLDIGDKDLPSLEA